MTQPVPVCVSTLISAFVLSIWTTLQDPVYGLKRPRLPFDPKKARQENHACDTGWTVTEGRTRVWNISPAPVPLHLTDADGGAAYAPTDQQKLSRGKTVFAENCARCHSSKQPPTDYKGDPIAMFSAVMQEDF